MDRISALRNVEDALREFEAGEADLAATERQVLAVLRTYATEFEGESGELAAYRASGDDAVDGVVVVAGSPADAEARVRELLAETTGAGNDEAAAGVTDAESVAFDVERYE